jgi:hypothetical protein
VSFGRRQADSTRQLIEKIQPSIEAAAHPQDHFTWAASKKLKQALDFRTWTPRGKGLVLLNVLVSMHG